MKRQVVAILLVAAALRVASVAIGDYRPVHDPASYDAHAQSIATGHGYPQSSLIPDGGPTAFRPPLYPLLLASVYAATATSDSESRWTAGLGLQVLLGLLVVALVGLLTWEISRNRRHAVIALMSAATYPPFLAWGTSLLSEPLFLALELAALLAALRYRSDSSTDKRGHWAWLVSAGVLVGLAGLTRSNGLVLLLPLAFAVWTARPRWTWRAVVAPATLLLATVLTVAPWTIRNAAVLDAFVPVSTQASFSLGGVFNEDARTDTECSACWRANVTAVSEMLAEPGITEVALGAQVMDLVVSEVTTHPWYVAEVGFWNSYRLFGFSGLAYERFGLRAVGVSPRMAPFTLVAFWLLLALGVAGARSRSHRVLPGFVWGVMPLMWASVVFTNAEPRYRAPIEVLLLIPAAVIACKAWGFIVQRHEVR